MVASRSLTGWDKGQLISRSILKAPLSSAVIFVQCWKAIMTTNFWTVLDAGTLVVSTLLRFLLSGQRLPARSPWHSLDNHSVCVKLHLSLRCNFWMRFHED